MISHWFSMIFHDFPWFSMIFHDFPWFSMIFHGEMCHFPWISHITGFRATSLWRTAVFSRSDIGLAESESGRLTKKKVTICVCVYIYIYINIIYYNILHLYNIYIYIIYIYVYLIYIYILLLSFIGLVDVWANINYLFLGGTERVEFWWNKRRKITQSM